MNYTYNGKVVRISDEQITKIINGLKVSKEEAINIYLEDEGIKDNPEQNALDKKAKDSKITQKIHGAKSAEFIYRKEQQKTQKERVVKANPTKERIIAEVAKILSNFAENVTVINTGKLIEFDMDGNHYKFDLVQSRKKK